MSRARLRVSSWPMRRAWCVVEGFGRVVGPVAVPRGVDRFWELGLYDPSNARRAFPAAVPPSRPDTTAAPLDEPQPGDQTGSTRRTN